MTNRKARARVRAGVSARGRRQNGTTEVLARLAGISGLGGEQERFTRRAIIYADLMQLPRRRGIKSNGNQGGIDPLAPNLVKAALKTEATAQIESKLLLL